ncbi:Nodule Cysteine-Rich (NCR) secreted peptide [Medicago truncatula]|uniref:Nodule Cysteine-Rich (NCR) secreted peptide n=1 Tax=Medicago truncatula TaxID=3880 RepID=A0A072TY61_MEDTR|nr:Nodule Cysteine-Rich (NCR) secreted peptide [Medicago truncatula]
MAGNLKFVYTIILFVSLNLVVAEIGGMFTLKQKKAAKVARSCV